MLKVLFVPNNSREVKQFGLVKETMGQMTNCHTLAISLNEKMRDLLQKGGFIYKDLKDYHTRNVINIVKQEKADIVLTDVVCSYESRAFVHAANYLGIPALQVDDGITGDFSTYAKFSMWKWLKKVAGWLVGRKEKFQSFPYIFFTLWAISKSARITKATAMSLKVCKDGVIVDELNRIQGG